uniref:Uncharacterized protein n=1 Tax=Sphaerodactylus townsendi TaxID=933632 RepID=A0ACB8G5C4_9SAUR
MHTPRQIPGLAAGLVDTPLSPLPLEDPPDVISPPPKMQRQATPSTGPRSVTAQPARCSVRIRLAAGKESPGAMARGRLQPQTTSGLEEDPARCKGCGRRMAPPWLRLPRATDGSGVFASSETTGCNNPRTVRFLVVRSCGKKLPDTEAIPTQHCPAC